MSLPCWRCPCEVTLKSSLTFAHQAISSLTLTTYNLTFVLLPKSHLVPSQQADLTPGLRPPNLTNLTFRFDPNLKSDFCPCAQSPLLPLRRSCS